jgi:hypothetical protein
MLFSTVTSQQSIDIYVGKISKHFLQIIFKEIMQRLIQDGKSGPCEFLDLSVLILLHMAHLESETLIYISILLTVPDFSQTEFCRMQSSHYRKMSD